MCAPTVVPISTMSASRRPSTVPGGSGSSRSGMYSPPSGAVPAKSASMKVIGGDAPRVLIHFMTTPSYHHVNHPRRALWPHRHRPALSIDRHQDDLGLCDLDPLTVSS